MISAFDRVVETLEQWGETLKEQAGQVGAQVKDSGYRLLEGWVLAIPKLEAYGLKTTFFSAGFSVNPTLELEFQAAAAAFPLGRVDAVLAENKDRTPVHLVFTAVKAALLLKERARTAALDPLVVRVRVRLSPEIKVSFGAPVVP
ncbi:MAG: hypothetical protein RLY31_92 [Bacteroidota bacterium]|jgi:hypothetical protein